MRHLLAIAVVVLGLGGARALAQSDGVAVQPINPRFPGRVVTAPVPHAKGDPSTLEAADDGATTTGPVAMNPDGETVPRGVAADDAGTEAATDRLGLEATDAARTDPADPAGAGEDTETVAATGVEVRELPRVLRPNVTVRDDDAAVVGRGTGTETGPDTETDTDASTGDGDGDTDQRRFVRAPDRTYGFDPDAPSPVAPIRTPETVLQYGARLRQLDKMTGTIQTYDIPVGETRRVERLRIRLDACRSPGENDTHGTMAFLKIWDTKHPDDPAAFSGWMFADSPALSALDHPRYDLWVISCTTISGEASAASE